MATITTYRDARDRWSAILLVALTVLAACFVILTSDLWEQDQERRALLRLSPEVRARVYAGALANLKELCAPDVRSPELTVQCQEQARFVAQFPDCDVDCRALVRSNLPRPTR